MDVSKTPPLTPTLTGSDVPAMSAPGGSTPPLAEELAAGVAGQGIAELAANVDASPGTVLASPQDWVDIRPLDPAAALQILIAEVRSELLTTLLAADGATTMQPGEFAAVDTATSVNVPGVIDGGTAAQRAASAAFTLVDLFLRAIPPATGDAGQWAAAVARVEQTVQEALQRAVATVAAWRGAEPAVTSTAREVQGQVLALISNEPLSPLWLSPEWFGLRPRIRSYWRRRRAARRRLLDPDYSQKQWESDCGTEGEAAEREGQQAS